MSRPRHLRRSLALAFAAVAGLGAAPVGAAPAGQPDAGRPDDRAVGLVLLDQEFAVEADGDLRLRFQVTGDLGDLLTPPPPPDDDDAAAPDEPDEPPAPTLSILVVNYEPLTTRDDPTRYVGAEPRTVVLSDPIDGVALADPFDRFEVDAAGDVVLDLSVGTDRGESVEDRIDFDEPGLYPVVVSLIAGEFLDGEVLASYGTIVQRLPGPGEPRSPRPIDLAIAAAIDEIGPEPSGATMRRALRELESMLALTTGVDSPVTLSIPPVVLEATGDPEALAEALADDRLLSVPAAPLDVSAAAAAGVTDAFARQLREGEDRLTAAVPANVARRDVWIATQPLSAGGAQVVRDLGFRYVVMSPALFRETIDVELPPTDLFVAIELPDGGTLPLLVVDGLGAALTTDATDEILAERTAIEWAVQAVSRLILDQRLDGGPVDRSMIVSTPDLRAPDPRLVVALERLVRTTPNLRFAEAGNLPGVTDVDRDGLGEVTVGLPERAGPDLSVRLERLDATALAMLSAGSMLPDDDPRPAAWSSQISELTSTGYSDDDVEAELASLTAEAERLKASVVPPEPFTFTLTGRSGDIDLRLNNTAAEPLTVLVRLSSPKLAFPDGEQLVALRPNEQTMIAVPVRARTNGTSSVSVEVLTPAGEAIHDPVVLTSRVNALTGFGQVLTGGLVLVLLTWWFSHWRARRRETAASAVGDVVVRHPSNGTR